LQLINIYNEKSLEPENPDYTIKQVLAYLVPSKFTILGGDFNAHHLWWNSTITSPIRAQALIQWLQEHRFDLISQPDRPTFYRKGMSSTSIIDLVFMSERLAREAIEWDIKDELASGSDHEILIYSILDSRALVQNPIYQAPYNLQKADWKAFSEKLQELDLEPRFQGVLGPGLGLEPEPELELDPDLDYHIGLEEEAINLQEIIKIAAEHSIPRRKPFSRSKA
jgi:Endonuclease-reverse transcriptase